MATVEFTNEPSKFSEAYYRSLMRNLALIEAGFVFAGNPDGMAAWEEHFGRALDLGWSVQKAAEIATQKTAHYRVK